VLSRPDWDSFASKVDFGEEFRVYSSSWIVQLARKTRTIHEVTRNNTNKKSSDSQRDPTVEEKLIGTITFTSLNSHHD